MTTITGEQLARIALDAGKLVMDIYSTDFDVERKDDASPVTEADQKAEDLILAALAEADPDLDVIAEESVAAGRIPDHDVRFALVDPLDGTKEFINKNGQFTVNIAIIEHGKPVMGVVYAPALNRLFLAESPDRAWQAEVKPGEAVPGSDARLPLHIRKAPEDGLTAIASKSHRSVETDEFLARFDVNEIISAGSSLKFCLVGAGEADIYPRMGRTMEWDTAAGHAIVHYAGGNVTDMDGNELQYGKPGFENPHFIVKGPGVAKATPDS